MKKFFFLSLFLLSLSLNACNNEKAQAIRLDRIFEESDFRFFELIADEKVVSVNIDLREGQTTISWRSNLQRDFILRINESCDVKDCARDFCYVISVKKGHSLGIAFLKPGETKTEIINREFSKYLSQPWQEYEIHEATPAPVYE